MRTTTLHISHLLQSRGMVSVPGMGTFVVRRVPAIIHGDEISAPSSAICFESYSAAVSDQELCSSIARALECDTTAACAIIADDVEHIRQEISLDGESTIAGVGVMRSEGLRLSLECESPVSWLKDIEAQPLPAYKAQEEERQLIEERREAFARSLRRTASSAAAIAGFAILAFIFSYLPGRRDSDRQIATIAYEQVVQATTPVPDTEEVIPELTLIFNTPADASCEIVDEPAVEQEHKYCLVVASLATRADAEEYMASIQEPCRILEKDGRYRIYILSADDMADISSQARAAGIYDRHPNAWICRL